jgi:hypothetical protein
MKRKIRMFIVTFSLLLITTGCGEEGPLVSEVTENEVVAVESPSAYSSVIEEPGQGSYAPGNSLSDDSIPGEKTSDEGTGNTGSDEADLAEMESVDIPDYIDLTEMSSTMVYSQVYNMVFYPERFTGTKVRMEGVYSDYFDMATGKHYFGCLIMDATACCAQGIEFQPTEAFSYPEDYPQDGDMVTVEGEFDIYTEDGTQYCTLTNAEIIDIVPMEIRDGT